MIADYDAVVLAGGRGSRLGGVSKPDLEVDGRRLLDTALAAARGAARIVVVGDVAVPPGVLRTREDPPYGGPVAGLEAGCAMLEVTFSTEHGGKRHRLRRAPWTLVLASDLPDAEAAVAVLLAADPGDADGLCLLDPEGRLQWLLGVYRSDVLSARLAARSGITAMYRLLEPLTLRGVDAGSARTTDLDTSEDIAAWIGRRNS